jgi:hypothetical protein
MSDSDNREPLGATTSEFPATPKLGIGTAGAPPQELRELLCQKCHRDYTVWFTDNPLWNSVAAEHFHFLCMDCFALMAEEQGVMPTAWYLTLEKLGLSRLRSERDRAVAENAVTKNFEHDAAKDLSETWEEVRRLRSENAELRKDALTPEEAEQAWQALNCYDSWGRPEYAKLRGKIYALRSTESSLRAPVK